MIELSPGIVTLLMLGGIVVGVLTGYPLAIPIGGVGLILGYLLFGNAVYDIIYSRLYNLISSYVLLAVPLFVFMGIMLERSGIADRMYDALYMWMSGVRGGLALSTVLLGTILAACVGVVGASITMMTLLALPPMIKRGYDKGLATGAVCASGCLGILIPPSVMLVVYGPMANVSVGKLFMAAFVPGFLLAALYLLYIGIYCILNPDKAPLAAKGEIQISLPKKLVFLITSLVPPLFMIFATLGSIFLGIAAPTEAAGVGAFAATLLAIMYRKFNFKVLKETALETMRVTSMILLIGGLAFAFVGVFFRAGADQIIGELIQSAPFGTWGAFFAIMFALFILGFFMDWLGILFILVPIIAPLMPQMGFDPLWFAMMVCVNLQMSFLTPPFAYAIFYLRGCAPPELGISTADIIRGVWPFVALIIVALGLCIAFPELILWLPSKMIR